MCTPVFRIRGLILLVLSLILVHANGLAQLQASVRLMTFNIRYNNAGDGFNAWPHRANLVESMIRFHDVDILGVQEALFEQVEGLEEAMPEYGRLGVGRDDGAEEGEFAAIFYRKGRFVPIRKGTFWLSENPERPGFGWDARHNRVCTWGQFQDLRSGKQFYVMNTHFDHQGEVARRESARLMLEKIDEFSNPRLPMILMGDFNMTTDSEPYQILTNSAVKHNMQDAWKHSVRPAHGPSSTWSGFSFPGFPDRRIDYLFTDESVQVQKIASLSDSWSGRFPSDHLPVLAEVLIDPIVPLAQAHAHNDYEHDRPLWDALHQGFTHLEADVWLIEGELYVSHGKPGPRNRVSLRELYLEPLSQLIESQDYAVFPGYDRPVYLMVDLKNEGLASYELLSKQLKSYQWMLDRIEGGSHVKGPIRVFCSGDRPVDEILRSEGALIGLDGRPSDLGKGIDPYVMPVVSDRFSRIVNWNGKGEIPEEEREKLKKLSESVHAEGKRLRLWATPEQEACWQVLRDCGIDLINTDELRRLRQFLNP